MKFIKCLIALLLTIVLVIPVQPVAAESSAKHVVSLGDSLAWGMNEQWLPGKGYTDFFAQFLEKEVGIVSYHNAFSFPGDKTTDLLADFSNNVTATIDSNGTTATIQDEIKKANIITISIGANDVLSTLTVKPEGIDFDLPTVLGAISTVGKNLTTILQQIEEWNADAEIYVMGLYNPYPRNEAQAGSINLLVNQIDTVISNTATNNGAIFVNVKDAMAKDATAYLPNPNNIHPSEVGYKVLADQFALAWKKHNGVEDEVVVPTPVPTPTPIEFKDVSSKHWAHAKIQQGVALGFIKGYTDTTFKPDNSIEKVHFTQMLVRPLNITAKKPLAFTDLGNYNDATKTQIAAAHEASIVRNTNGKFNPKQNITRIEVVRMVYAANTYVTGEAYVPSKTVTFKDTTSLSKEDQKIISALNELAVVSGYPGNLFKPNNQITRAEATTLLLKYLETVE